LEIISPEQHHTDFYGQALMRFHGNRYEARLVSAAELKGLVELDGG
jgi:hypothetical protein